MRAVQVESLRYGRALMRTLCVVLALLLVAACGPAGSNASTTKCGGLVTYDQGTSTKILALGVVKDLFIILSSNGTMLVHDPKDLVANSVMPKLIGSVVLVPGLTGSSEGTLLMNGTTAFAFIGSQLKVVDFSDPTMPKVTGTGNVGPGLLAAQNDTLLVDAAGMGFVRVLDKSNLTPTPPPAYLSLGATALALSGTTLAVVESDSKRLSLYGLETPAMPTTLGKLTLPQTARGLRFDGTTLYAFDHDTFQSVNVSDPMNPTLLFEKGTPVVGRSAFPNVESVWFTSKQLLVPGAALSEGKGVNLFDVTDPKKPVHVPNGMCGPNLDMRFMVRAGQRIIIADEHTLAFNEL